MTVEAPTQESVLRQLAATPEGLTHILSTTVEAEEGDESGIFEQLIALVDVPKLKRLAERHHRDELRHARIFRDWLDRLGLPFTPLPEELRFINQIGVESGGRVNGIRTNDDLVATYAMLHVIEQRGVQRYPLIADAVEPHVPELAATYREVTEDEKRHVRYCATVGRHYAGSEEAWQAMVAITSEIEAAAFEAVGSRTLEHLRDTELVT